MNRIYEKPMVLVDRFELTQTIAACVTKIGFVNSDCVFKDADSPIDAKRLAYAGWFTAGNCGDKYVITGMASNDGICYHTSTNAMFSS